MGKKPNPHWGTTLDEFLGEVGIREAARAEALTRVVAWQLAQEMGAAGNHQGGLGGTDAHQPRAGGPDSDGEGQRDDREPAARGGAGRAGTAG